MKHLASFLFILSLCSLSFAADNYKDIKPNNPAIQYIGRFYAPSADSVLFDWPGTYFRCNFTGKNIGLRLNGAKDIYYNVFIDDLPAKTFSSSNEILWVARNLKAGKHTLKVYKRTESLVGISVFKGIVIDANAEISPFDKQPTRHLEFIGNSITCGYGTEGASKNDHFKPETENNYHTYAAYLSRAFNADYSIVAHSGMGVVRNYGDSLKISKAPQMPARFFRTLDNNDTLKWNFSKWHPDAVFINLGTNDFSTQPFPDKAVFQRTYEQLILNIRKVYGNIPVICLVGPMTDEPCFSYVKEMTENMKLLYGEKNIYFIGLPAFMLNPDTELGSDWHPSASGQKKMAELIAPVAATVLGWDFQKIE